MIQKISSMTLTLSPLLCSRFSQLNLSHSHIHHCRLKFKPQALQKSDNSECKTTGVIVIGAGLAGLAAATRLKSENIPFLLLEASDAVGGRVRTDSVDGFLLDRGFQIFITAYPEAQKLLDYEALHLQKFYSGARVYCDGQFHTIWPPGSLEEKVQNLVKTWEMEIFHKTRLEDFKTLDPNNYTLSLNGRKPITMEGLIKLGGGYNPLLQTSLPEKYRSYDPAVERADSSHRAFTTTFPRGFAVEIIQVYSGPPQIVYKFRHWGFMEGPFKGHAPTGEMVEFYGMAIFQVNEHMKVEKVEFFYDPGELLGGLMKGATIDDNKATEETSATCPFLRNTG